MKLTFLITGLNYGGAETQMVRLAIQLNLRGWAVSVVSMLRPQAYLEELRQLEIPVKSLKMRRGVPDPRAVLRLVSILRSEQPVALTSFLYHANLLGRLAGRYSGVPVVVSSIRNENFGGPVRDRILRLTDWLADVTTINSHLAGHAVVRRRVVPDRKLRVIPNGLDTAQYVWTSDTRAQLRHDLGLNQDEFLWLAIGRLEKQKDYPNLLAAFSRVVQEYPRAVLCIVGQGPLLQRLEEERLRLGLDGRVRFLGVRPDIPRVLAGADALVLASAWEGLPNAVIEAMAASKPVVATRVGGIPELVQEGKNGYIVRPQDSEALARAMLNLMSLSPVIRHKMGQAGRAQVEANYSLERVVDQWEALYLELLQRKGVKV